MHVSCFLPSDGRTNSTAGLDLHLRLRASMKSNLIEGDRSEQREMSINGESGSVGEETPYLFNKANDHYIVFN